MMESWNVGIAGDEGNDNYVRVETRLDRHPKVNLRLAISQRVRLELYPKFVITGRNIQS
jgi:hypothetical protein